MTELIDRNTKVVFVNDGFYLGGIEVLEAKLLHALLKSGTDACVACNAQGVDRSAIEGVPTVLHDGLLDLIRRAPDHFSDLPKDVVLASFQPKSAMASILLAKRLRKNLGVRVRLFHWVSHSRAFFFSGNHLMQSLLKMTFFRLPVESVHFMNDAAVKQHAKKWKTNLDAYPILRIVGREPKTEKKSYTPSSELRIASVGRLVPFKAYNLYSPDIIKRLHERGTNATWDIWGYGPDEAEIVKAIEKVGVQDKIRLRGSLHHDVLDATVSDYDLFIGMGTAALEAAKAGVPTILALENGADRGYGFLSEVPGDTVGDKVTRLSEIPIIDSIEKFQKMSETQREALGRKCSRAAMSRESTLEEFLERVISSSREPDKKGGRTVFEVLALLYFWMSKVLRGLR